MDTAATIYYASIWGIGFVCGISRTLRNGDYRGLGHCVSVGLFSGCLGFAIVAILDGYQRDDNEQSVFYLGVAAIVGLSGKEQVYYLDYAVKSVARRLGIRESREDESED